MRMHFDEDLPAGGTICFEELVTAREPNLVHRKMGLQTRSSMDSGGVASGFSSPLVRTAFRQSVLDFLRVPEPALRVPTVTYLSRASPRTWQKRCHIGAKTFRALQTLVRREAGLHMQHVTFEQTSYAFQAQVVSTTDIFWAAHGAGLVHLPLLPSGAVAIEMFNCGHYSYLYANLALRLQVKYFAMQRLEPYCYRPQSLAGDSRRNLTKAYEYTRAEAEPVLMQAVRYLLWRDPDPEISGLETECAYARKVLSATGSLPAGTNLKTWRARCHGPGSRSGASSKRQRSLNAPGAHTRALG
jgi:hypothetical protein